MNNNVEYRDIPDYLGYRAGSDGTFWTCWERYYPPGAPKGTGTRCRLSDNWVQMTPTVTRTGHLRIPLRRDGKSRLLQAARVVLTAFVGPCPEGMEACHNDGNPANNAVGNLRWDTHSENLRDRRRHGTAPVGENGGGAKLSNDDVLSIRYARKLGIGPTALARIYRVSRHNIKQIIKRKTWWNLPEENDPPGTTTRKLKGRPENTVEWDGREWTSQELADHVGLPKQVLHRRLFSLGWEPEKAVSTPHRKR